MSGNRRCKYCGSEPSKTYKGNRSHCFRTECRDKEIKKNLDILINPFRILLRNEITACVEIRLPGNDGLGHEIKVESVGNISDDVNYKNVKMNNDKLSDIENIKSYFEKLLWRGLKGNFIVETEDGRINSKILNQVFTPFETPTIIGNNAIITMRKKL